MDLVLLFTGVVVGFFVAAPVGPVAVLCIQRTLLDGRIVGFGTGLGAAVGDAVFGALAIFFVAVVESFLQEHRPVIQALGSFVLIGIGVRTVATRNNRAVMADGASSKLYHETLLHAFGSAFAVTIVNPITILAFLAILAQFHISETTDGLLDSWLVIVGIFVGAAAWWFLLASVASVFRQRFTQKGLKWMNAISGMVILGFGLYGLLDFAWRL
ncbi:MAG: LysE family translocator [Rhodospirillales bacterium]|nr:LysE family translocator [Rhodospirillales bacterium]